MTNLKFAYFGTPYVARDTLATLLAAGLRPAVVITNPDAPRGRGHVLTSSDTKLFALQNNLAVLTPETLGAEAIAEIQKFECEYAVVVAYGKIFSQALIDAFPRGAINVHYSLLPKYRGASPVESALLNGETVTGVTIQKLALKMDAGDILAQKELAILPDETARELKPRLIALGSELLLATLPTFERGGLIPIRQDDARATRARKFTKEDGHIALSDSGEQNWHKYRAFAEWPGTYLFDENGKRIKITKAKFKNGEFVIEKIIPEGGREIPYEEAQATP